MSTLDATDADVFDDAPQFVAGAQSQTAQLIGVAGEEGVRSLGLRIGSTTVATAGADCSTSCPRTFTPTVTFDFSTVTEGYQRVTVDATSGSGATDTSPYGELGAVIVDKSAPSAPTAAKPFRTDARFPAP